MKVKIAMAAVLLSVLAAQTVSGQYVPPPTRAQRFGAYYWSPPPPVDNPLPWGADRVALLGSEVIRIALDASDNYRILGRRWEGSLADMVNPATNGGHYEWDTVFRNPSFKTILLTAYTQRQDPWLNSETDADGLTDAEYAAEKEELRQLSAYLLNTYRDLGKTFVIINWEGDHGLEDFSFHHDVYGAGFDFYDGQPLTALAGATANRVYDRQSATLPINSTVRYVRVQLPDNTMARHNRPRQITTPMREFDENVLSLAEVQVFGADGATNLALNKPARQSSTATVYGGDAKRANDGNTNGAYWDKSVSHTTVENHPWWEVDLGSDQNIGSIKVWNRTDGYSYRLDNFIVTVYPSTRQNPARYLVTRDINDTNLSLTQPITLPILQQGRYVRVQLTDSAARNLDENVLSLAEVQVLGIDGVTNLALKKPARQSSTTWGGTADRANDGNTDGNYGGGSVSHTGVENPPWWEVDLGEEVPVSKITVWNRTDCCSHRLNGFAIKTYTSALTTAATRVYGQDMGPIAIADGDALYADVTVNTGSSPSTRFELRWQDQANEWHVSSHQVDSRWIGRRIWLQKLATELPGADGSSLVGRSVKRLEFVVTDGSVTLHAAGRRRSATRWDDLVRWVNARAEGVREARNYVGTASTSRVFSALEFYQTYSRAPNFWWRDVGEQYYRYDLPRDPRDGQLIRTGADDAAPSNPPDPQYFGKYRSVLSYVAPRVSVDFFSYSSYETLGVKYSPNVFNKPTTTPLKTEFKENLNFALNAVKSLGNNSQMGEGNFIIGEWSFDKPELINEFVCALDSADAFRPAYILFWEYTVLFDRTSRNLSPTGQFYKGALQNAVCDPTLAAEQRVNLKSWENKFVVAEDMEPRFMYADRDEAQSWETITFVDINGGTLESRDSVYLRTSNPRYFAGTVPTPDGDTMRADKTVPEAFTILKTDGFGNVLSGSVKSGDKIALRTQNNRYVVAEAAWNSNPPRLLNANRVAINAWEQFTVQFLSQ